MMVAEMELSKVDNKTKLETTLQEEAAIKQDNKDREMERLADAAEKAARVQAFSSFPQSPDAHFKSHRMIPTCFTERRLHTNDA